MAKQLLRCAIYTRKSTEEGLEQEFNSLDAQREACEAYIKSQAHEGWTPFDGNFDDGGYSGGNLQRPALCDLLKRVAAKQVDVIVVYKIDRLTRSLGDFAKIVEILDKAGASFVSVTQAFNTTTSMGRLTLNVLLSFAQFEREVTGERIRDKIAASKAKGMWMGGPIPLGYEVQNRRLVINEEDAAAVRHFFQRYSELASVVALVDELEAQGFRTKVRTGRRGKVTGGQPITRNALYHLLKNPIYVGEVLFKGVTYQGQHEAIVDRELFAAVQSQLGENRVARRERRGSRERSILASRVFDADGERLGCSHCRDGAKRYRYYVAPKSAPGAPSLRVPAGELEPLVLKLLREFLDDPPQLRTAMEPYDLAAAGIARLLEGAAGMAEQDDWSLLPLIKRVTVLPDKVQVEVSRGALVPAAPSVPAEPLVLSVGAKVGRCGKEVRLIVEPKDDVRTERRDPALLKLMVRAHQARRAIETAKPGLSVKDIATLAGYEINYFRTLLRLSYLAPDIVEAILDGNQPPQLTRQKLARFKGLPLDWTEQRKLLGFS